MIPQGSNAASILYAFVRLAIRRLNWFYQAAPYLLEAAWNYCLSRRADETFTFEAEIRGRRRHIEVDAFLPSRRTPGSRLPTIVLLHGIEGALRYAGRNFRVAAALAKKGYAVYYVHYFDSVEYKNLWHFREDGKLDVPVIEKICERDRDQWIAAVTAAIGVVSERPEVDSEQIALMGYSLGCFVSLSTADALLKQKRIPKVAAVVGNWGAKWRDVTFSEGFPPTRLFHGTKDPVILLDWARETLAYLHGIGVDASLVEIPRQGHRAFSRKAWREILAFLDERVVNGCQSSQMVAGA